jgi:hypothetical protein
MHSRLTYLTSDHGLAVLRLDMHRGKDIRRNTFHTEIMLQVEAQ